MIKAIKIPSEKYYMTCCTCEAELEMEKDDIKEIIICPNCGATLCTKYPVGGNYDDMYNFFPHKKFKNN